MTGNMYELLSNEKCSGRRLVAHSCLDKPVNVKYKGQITEHKCGNKLNDCCLI
jgi:hypothetical protein